MKKKKKELNKKKIKKALESELKKSKPRPMSKVAKKLDYGLSMLRYHFPEECKAISARRKEYVQIKRKSTLQKFKYLIRTKVLKLHEQGVYPSKRAVLEQLPKKGYLRDNHGIRVWQKTLQELGYSAG